jgi:Transglycosylase SLT domain
MAGIAVLALTCNAQAGTDAASDPAIAEASGMYAIPQSWIRAVIAVESAGNPRALSRSGAIGLMQLMPSTWAVLRDRLHLGADPYNPRDNVMAGTALLRELYDRFGPDGFLAAYNASPQRYLAYVTQGKPLTEETRSYLAHIALLLGDAELGRSVAGPATSPSWKGAPLFVARQTVALESVEAPSASDSDTNPAPIPSRFQAQSNGLFTALSGAATP